MPAYKEGEKPFGVAKSERLYSWKGWTQSEDYNWDIAYIKLDRPIGALTGWLGYGYKTEDRFYKTGTFYNPSYPAAKPYDGQKMYSHRGNYTQVYDEVLYFDKPFYGGSSGSGTYYKQNNNRYVTAVHSHTQKRLRRAGQTRMTSSKFNAIRNKIKSNTPSSADLVPLRTRADDYNIRAGAYLDDITFVVHNYSSKSFNSSLNVEILPFS